MLLIGRFKFVALLIAVFGPWFIATDMIPTMYRQNQAAKWPTVEGEVTGQHLLVETTRRRRSSSETTKYAGRAAYTYQVNGTTYDSDLTSLGDPEMHSDQEDAWKDVVAWPEGSKVAVHYNPADPSEAVIQTGIPSGSWLGLFGSMAATVACMAWSFFIVKGFFQNDEAA